jgi:hypothetical protein
VQLEAPRVHPQSALGYAVLLAAVTLVAWFAARLAGFAHPWWLPLAVVAISEPVQERTARHALLQSLLAVATATVLVFVTDAFDAPLARAALLVLMAFVALAAGSRRHAVQAVLIAPVLVLLSNHTAIHEAPVELLRSVLPALVPVLAVSGLGHWLYWTLRTGTGRVPV